MQNPAAELVPGLLLVHGNRAEQLRDVLVAWMRNNPLAPLENEYLLVQSNGIAQWLRLALAHDNRGGVAAALDFLLPSRFMWQAYRTVLGGEAVPEHSPLDKDALVWRLVRLLPVVLEKPEYAVLQRFLADDAEVRKRYQLASRLADLFDQYQVYRADWLQAWAEGRIELPDGRGGQHELPATQAWQAHLWRALLDDLLAADESSPSYPVGRAAVHAAFMDKVHSADEHIRPAGLPRRILVFGVSAMPRQTFEALVGLSRWAQILVCVHNPCAHYWADIQGDQEQLRTRYRRQRRRPGMPDLLDEAALHQQTHPLLASWGRQGRDYIGMLDDFDDPDQRSHWVPMLADLHKRVDAFEALPGATLLEQLQDDIRDLRPLSESRLLWPEVDPLQDDSLRFQVAHSAQREVDILQDQLLAAFEADPSLQPGDVIVMVPDIEAYAPHVQATFGLYGPEDKRHIPYALADRSTRHADPLVLVLEQLLTLPRHRLGINEVLEWLDLPALRRRFDIEAEDLPLLQSWIRESQVRWGLHADHRATFELDQDRQSGHFHTWQFGLQRMLLGYAVGPGAPAWDGIEAYDEPSGLQAAVLGGLARLLDTVDRYWRVLSQPANPGEWVTCFQALLDDFFEVDAAGALALNRFRERLQEWLEHCEQASLDEPLPSAIVVEHCLTGLDESSLSQRFFAGAVTFATLMPMRAIPFRHVYLLGMHDGAFPRVRPASDMDLMALHPRSGDRSRREDDRYLFLEALLSARDRLSLSWVGHSIVDNAEQPPSVLVAQLRDHLDRGWRLAGGRGLVSRALTCHHPLQPFSRRYFPLEPTYGPQGLYTYAAEWRSARESLAQAVETEPALEIPVPGDSPLTLQRLSVFLKYPVRAFYRQRLSVDFSEIDLAFNDKEPYVHDGLEQWQLRDALIQVVDKAEQSLPLGQALSKAVLDDALGQGLQHLLRSGSLAGGGLGRLAADALRSQLETPLENYLQVCGDWPVRVDEPLRLDAVLSDPWGQSWPFQDTLSQWRQNQEGAWCRVLLRPGHLVDKNNHYRFKSLIDVWLEHVAAHVYGRPSQTEVITPKGKVSFAPLMLEPARKQWHDWWHSCFEGMTVALPLEINAAGAWLRAGTQSDADLSPDSKAWQAAANAYESSVATDPYLLRHFPDFDALVRGRRFFELAEALYGVLNGAVPKSSRRRARSAEASA